MALKMPLSLSRNEMTRLCPRIRLICSVEISFVGRVVAQPFDHDVQVFAVILELRALVGVGDVLDHQRMQVKSSAELRQHLHLVQAGDVDPAHARTVAQREALLHGLTLLFDGALLVVVQQGQTRGFALALTEMHRCAGREAGLARAFGRESGHKFTLLFHDLGETGS